MIKKGVCLLLLVLTLPAFSFNNIVEERLSSLSNNKKISSPSTQSKLVYLLVYSSRCHYCKLFAPAFNQWAKKTNANYISMSLDNSNTYPNTVPTDENLINTAFGDMPRGTPALFLINETRKTIYPVLFGNASLEELIKRDREILAKVHSFEEGA